MTDRRIANRLCAILYDNANKTPETMFTIDMANQRIVFGSVNSARWLLVQQLLSSVENMAQVLGARQETMVTGVVNATVYYEDGDVVGVETFIQDVLLWGETSICH